MTLTFDHAVIAVHNLEAAMHDYTALGFTVVRGGIHANHATENALIYFVDGTYLELLARTNEPPLPDLIDFSPMLEYGEGWVGFALGSDDLDAEIARLRANGFNIGDAIPGERKRRDGVIVQWKLALLENGFAPFFIQDVTPRVWRVSDDPSLTTHGNGMTGVGAVEIGTALARLDFDNVLKSSKQWFEKIIPKNSS